MQETLVFVIFFLFGVAAWHKIRASVKLASPTTNCKTLSATPDGKGGASVVFDCGVATETIHEPVWP